MPTIHSLTQANRFTNPVLVAGVIEAFGHLGAPEFASMINFVPFEGTSYDFNRESALPTGTSVVDPYGTTEYTGGVGSTDRKSVPARQFARNCDTPKIDVIGKSDINAVRTENLLSVVKALGQEWSKLAVQGTGVGNQVHGMDYWVDLSFADGHTLVDMDGANAALDGDMINDMLSRHKFVKPDAVFMSRASWVSLMHLIAEAPGNTAQHLMDPYYGAQYLQWNGVRWYRLDTLELDKTIAIGNATFSNDGGGNTRITLTSTDNAFPGFSRSDIGKTITDGTNSGVVDNFVSSTVVDVDTATMGLSGTNATALTVTGVNDLIYSVSFDPSAGFCAPYLTNPQPGAAPRGMYTPEYAGFAAYDLGELEALSIFRSRVEWYGTFAQKNPHSIVRLRNFAQL